jgi:hypothetical protein
MNSSHSPAWWRSPRVRVVATWAWSVVGPLLLALIVLTALQTDLGTARRAYAERP